MLRNDSEPDDPVADDHYGEPDMELLDLRVTVDSVEGVSYCGLRVGDYFDLDNSAELRLPEGWHFCVYALQAVLPVLPAKQSNCRPQTGWSGIRCSAASILRRSWSCASSELAAASCARASWPDQIPQCQEAI
jgi:uncharacterized repeat protein (TIGR04076 family)